MNWKNKMVLANKNKAVWDHQWGSLAITEKDVIHATTLEVFGDRAYSCFSEWISRTDKRILEAGSGTGRFCIAFAKDFQDSLIYGVDISKNSISLSRKGAKSHRVDNIGFILGDLFNLPFPDDYFDVVFNEGVIEHFHNYKDSVKEMIRVTKPTGKIIVAVPNWYCFPHTIYKKIVSDKFEYGYEKSFKHSELIEVAKECGLEYIEITGFYPAHGIKRLAKYSRLFEILGDFTDKIVIYLDNITRDRVSKKFGFEIVIKGIKSHKKQNE